MRARSPASFASSRRTFSGTRKRTVPSRSPNARYGPVSQDTLSPGSTARERNEPPRWALTEKRKSGGVAATHASTLGAFGDA